MGVILEKVVTCKMSVALKWDKRDCDRHIAFCLNVVCVFVCEGGV